MILQHNYDKFLLWWIQRKDVWDIGIAIETKPMTTILNIRNLWFCLLVLFTRMSSHLLSSPSQHGIHWDEWCESVEGEGEGTKPHPPPESCKGWHGPARGCVDTGYKRTCRGVCAHMWTNLMKGLSLYILYVYIQVCTLPRPFPILDSQLHPQSLHYNGHTLTGGQYVEVCLYLMWLLRCFDPWLFQWQPHLTGQLHCPRFHVCVTEMRTPSLWARRVWMEGPVDHRNMTQTQKIYVV